MLHIRIYRHSGKSYDPVAISVHAAAVATVALLYPIYYSRTHSIFDLFSLSIIALAN